MGSEEKLRYSQEYICRCGFGKSIYMYVYKRTRRVCGGGKMSIKVLFVYIIFVFRILAYVLNGKSTEKQSKDNALDRHITRQEWRFEGVAMERHTKMV